MATTGQLIDLKYARQLAKNYKLNKLDKGEILTDDTQAVWFSKDVLLAALGAPTGSGAADVSGIRFYFGAYESQEGYPQNSFDRNKLTLVMVQTGTDRITIDRNGVSETAFLDVTGDPDPSNPIQPAYPNPADPVTGKTCYNEGQMAPPPNNAAGLGLMDW